MSVEGMREAWNQLGGSARDLYASRGQNLAAGRPLEHGEFSELSPILDRMLAASEQLRQQGDAAIRSARDEEYEQISELLLAAAAVDAMLARDIVALDPDSEYDRYEDPLEEDASPERVFEEGQRLLEDADLLFRESPESSAGRAPGASRRALTEQVESTTSGLVDLAEPPARDLARGLLSAAGGGVLDFLSAAQHIDVVHGLDERAVQLGKHAPRFLREHVAKIVTLRRDDWIVDQLSEQVTEWIAKHISIEALLNGVSARPAAVARASGRIAAAPDLTEEQGEALLTALMVLESNYRKHMQWLGRSARWLRRGASPLAHLGALAVGPLSYAIVSGVFFVGIGYVGYSLTDRLDARNLGFADRVEGVVRLVESHIPG
jgi:hypothetical protein